MINYLNDQRISMLLQFSDHPREGHEQARYKHGVRIFIHGIGFRTVKIEQMVEIRISDYGEIIKSKVAQKDID